MERNIFKLLNTFVFKINPLFLEKTKIKQCFKEGFLIYTTVITHFYNEEYLLPWWLLHHTKLFDYGILINRGSTDLSVEICRKFAPHWEIYDSNVREFDTVLVDEEVMDVEKTVRGWKMTLNSTEFLCCKNKVEFFNTLNNFGKQMYAIRTILMIDPSYNYYPDPSYMSPLIYQRYHGNIPQNPHIWGDWRFIHKFESGKYGPGRHFSAHEYIQCPYNAFILKFYLSPWTDAMKKRKLQIAPTLSANWSHLKSRYGNSLEELESRFIEHTTVAQDLRLIPEYQSLFPFL